MGLEASPALARECMSSQEFCDFLFLRNYPPLRLALAKAMRKKFSKEEFLEMELEMKMLTCKTPVCYFTWKVKDILDVFSLFYQASVEEKNDSLLVAAIKNPFVPWIWCEHVAFAHPEQINQTNSGKL